VGARSFVDDATVSLWTLVPAAMRTVRQRLPAPLLAITVFGLVVGGMSLAAKQPSSSSRITACYSKKSGALRVVKQGKRCRKGERKLTWTKSGARGSRGIRGERGSEGERGPQGAAGAAGPAGSNGAAGAPGPSDSYEAFNTGSVSITGTDDGSANSLATRSNVAPGNYVVTARVQLTSAGTSSRVVCTASLGSRNSSGRADVGTQAGNSQSAVIFITFNVALASTGTANVRCHWQTLFGSAPTASDAFLELLKVGSVDSQAVSS
jgi:collagen triple helix repeat protein